MPSIAATEPALYVAPSITDASSWTTPSSFGSPPYPTLVSVGSTSMMFAARSTASIALPPAERMSQPSRIAFWPASLEWAVMIIGAMRPSARRGSCPPALRTSPATLRGRAPRKAAPAPIPIPFCTKPRRFISFGMYVVLSWGPSVVVLRVVPGPRTTHQDQRGQKGRRPDQPARSPGDHRTENRHRGGQPENDSRHIHSVLPPVRRRRARRMKLETPVRQSAEQGSGRA